METDVADPNRARNLLTKIKKAKRTRAKGRQRPNPPGKALGLRGLAPGRRRDLPTPAKRSGSTPGAYQLQPTGARRVGPVAPTATPPAPTRQLQPTVPKPQRRAASPATPGRTRALPVPPGLAKKAAGARSARAFAPGRKRG